jgi:dGTPase
MEEGRLIHESVRRLINRMVNDVVDESRRRIEAVKVSSVDDVRRQHGPLVSFSDAMREQELGLRKFLFERMYRHHRVNRMTSKARRVVTALFEYFTREPDGLPAEWRDQTVKSDPRKTARVVADYIAGMTDRFALDEYGRLFDHGVAP